MGNNILIIILTKNKMPLRSIFMKVLALANISIFAPESPHSISDSGYGFTKLFTSSQLGMSVGAVKINSSIN